MKRNPLLPFFALAYAISWALWAPAVFAHLGWIQPVPTRALHLLGATGPMLAAIAMSASSGRACLEVLGHRCIRGGVWILAGAALPALLFLAAMTAISVISPATIDWSATAASAEWADVPRPVYWLANLFFYGFGEEVGWRGYALPRLQSRASAVRASLTLALGWAGWHLPLFVFSPGLAGLGMAGAAGWLMSLCLGSVLLTWLFNSSGGSIATVALFHAALDIFITSPVSPDLPNVMGALITVGTLALIPVFGPENLARRPRVV